jgi:hypothetical protein
VNIGRASAVTSISLESAELIIRGELRRRVVLRDVRTIREAGDWLWIETADESIGLLLGAELVPKWRTRMQRPAPTLASKLGVSPDARGVLLGAPPDETLAVALADCTTATLADASVAVIVATTVTQLLAAESSLRGQIGARHVWVVHPKGAKSTLGDTAVRAFMRTHGYVDNKTSAVSDALTATRYRRASA